ncbi:MAG: glycosyltransferase, partial [Gammaproteobacteria bacterium]|nr:glycosyltransferase [Gammaproteobacteria bacterium]
VSNASEAPETFALLRELEADPRVRFVEYNVPFNFSRLVNFGVAQARGEYVVLLNNDMEIITYDWIEALLEHAQREEVGCVGGKLYFEDSTVQHGGIIIGIGGYAGHAHKGFPSFRPGYFNRLNVSQNISAVTGACLMIRRALYQELGGFNEEQLGVACNDVDFCLRVREAGYLNMWTPFMEAFHYESRSRGYEDTPEKKARFEKERAWFRERHRDLLERGDPYYNANLSLDSEKFELGA